MSIVNYVPRPPLAQFVDVFWLYERETPTHAKELLLPTGTMELVVDLTNDSAGMLVCGAHSESFEIETARPALILGVHFKPGGAFPFLGLPAGELHNARVSLDTLWGSSAQALLDRVLEAKTPAAKFGVLEQALVVRLTRPFVRHPAVAFALKEFHAATHVRTVSELVDEIGLSPRRFIQLFRDQVGLTPKVYRRIRRFQDLLQRVHGAQHIDWALTAVDCGYYDQAHFIHDFRAFSGLNPTAYLRTRGEHLNHVPLMD
jgi:AraC-like DNA-binding protein